MAQDKVQLKREEVVGNDVVLQDINPKTKTNSVTDSTKGVPLDQTLAMIKNMINNKLSRVVNSVNGKTGIVILDANDVGLGNVDNISFGDIKRWVIEYMGDIFENKKIILKEYLSQIYDITATNDKIYDNSPFYVEKGMVENGDYIAYIGRIYWDENTSMLQEEHRQIKVVGYTDESLIYNTNCDIDRHNPNDYRNLSGGGLAVNIWSKEDALKIRRAEGLFTRDGFDPSVLNDTGLWIDKSKVVPNVYFFDGIYGTLTGEGGNMRNENALVYWTYPQDSTESELPILEITMNGQAIGMTSTAGGDPVNTLHLHPDLELKVGDIILTNFAFDPQYINPADPGHREGVLYPRMLDSLTCRQPSLGVVTRAADTTINQSCVIDFKPQRPNVGHGLKLIITDSATGTGPVDSEIGLDLMESTVGMDGNPTPIDSNSENNVSGINAIDKHDPMSRSPRTTPKHLYTVYPTGKSSDLIGGSINIDSSFIIPNFSMCVIPANVFNKASGEPIIKNWNPTSPMTNTHAGETLGHARKFNMVGVNLTKVIMDTNVGDEDYAFARNVSGLRVNTSDDSFDEDWYGFSTDGSSIPNYPTSGGISVNVGDFLGIGTPTELSASPAEKGSYYNEGKVNVRIDRMQGLNGVAGNKLAVNLAGGYQYAPEGVTHNWLEGGLTFVNGGTRAPGQGLLAVNTAEEASGLGIKNSYNVNYKYLNWGNRLEVDTYSNVLGVKPAKFAESSVLRSGLTKSGLEVHTHIQEEDFANKITFSNIYNQKMWKSEENLHDDMVQNPSSFDTSHIYIAGGKRYIYAELQGQPTPLSLFMYYSTEEEYDAIITWIRTGNDSDVPDSTWPIHGYDLTPNEHTTANDECLAILRRQCHVLIQEDSSLSRRTRYKLKASISEPTTSEELRLPDLDHDGKVDATEASSILGYNSFLAVSTSVYSTTVGGQKVFYTDPGLTTPLVPIKGRGYIDMNDFLVDPENSEHTYYMPYDAVTDPGSDVVYLKKYEFDMGRPVTLQDIMYADVDRDGRINSIDASRVLTFYANASSGKYPEMDANESWKTYLREAMGIIVGEGTREVYQVLDMSYDPGVRIRYNEQKGLTTFANYFGNSAYDTRTLIENDMKDALSIKIADTTSGMFEFDPGVAGGLRFGSNGYLAVRINNNNNYSSILPIKNNPAHIDDLSTGSRGLRIYNTDDAFNVLGIQLSRDGSLDNGELKIDAQGCLRLSSAIRPDVKTLTFAGQYADGAAVSIAYDGSEPLTINLGPGLCFASST